MKLKACGLVGGFLAASAVMFGAAHAQDFQRYKPQTLPVPQYQPAVPPKPVAPVEGSDTVLVDRWDAVLVLDEAAKVKPLDAYEELMGLHFDVADRRSLVYSAEFKKIVSNYIGGPISLRQLNQLSRDIILMYRRSGYPVVDVIIPEQKITAGSVQIIVLEARIGNVLVKGGSFFDPSMLANQIENTQSGARLSEGALKADLFWLNRNPFRRVEVDLQPGDAQGTTDVIYKVRDVRPIRGYTGYEDTGVEALGIDRVYAGFIWGNVFGRDGQFSYQYTTDTQFDRLRAHAYTYQKAFDRDWSIQTYGAYSEVESFVVPINQTGYSWLAGGQLIRTLDYEPTLNSWLSFGIDVKSTTNNLEFNEAPVTNGRADMWELNYGYDRIRRFNDVEYLILSQDLFVGPNGGLAFNDAAAYNTIRPNSRPGFVYDKAMAEGVVALPFGMQLLGRFTGQVASQRLLYSETLGFGGFNSIRGYDQRVFNGDAGCFTNFEFGPQTWNFGTERYRKDLRVYGFFDYGTGYVRDPVPGEQASQTLSSVGAGFRMSCTDRLSLRFDYGHGLTTVANARVDSRVHLGLVYLLGPRRP